MDGITVALNQTGKSFVRFALPMLIQSSVLIVILLGLDFLLRRKVRAVFRYFLWMLVLVKLVLPTTLSSPTGVNYWIGGNLSDVEIESSAPLYPPESISKAGETGDQVTPPENAGTPPAKIDLSAAPVSVPPAEPLTWQAIALIVYAAVVAAMLLLLTQRILFVRGLVRQSRGAGAELISMLEECRVQLGIKSRVGLKLSPNAASPAVCGLFRPVILIPENLPSDLSRGQLKTVLLHELSHIKRGDLWVNMVQTLLQIVYFYNPLLWLANLQIGRAREQAVDEMVLVAMGKEAEKYPDTLINVARLSLSRPSLSLRLIGVVESKKALSGRIKHILNRPLPKSAKLGIAGLIVLFVFAAVLLPMAGAEKEMATETAEVAETKAEFESADALIRIKSDGKDRIRELSEGNFIQARDYLIDCATGEILSIAVELYEAGKPVKSFGRRSFKWGHPKMISVIFTRKFLNEEKTEIEHSVEIRPQSGPVSGVEMFLTFTTETASYYPGVGSGFAKEVVLNRIIDKRTAQNYKEYEYIYYYFPSDGGGDAEDKAKFWIPDFDRTMIPAPYYIVVKAIANSQEEYPLADKPMVGYQGLDGKIISDELASSLEEAGRDADKFTATLPNGVIDTVRQFIAALEAGDANALEPLYTHGAERAISAVKDFSELKELNPDWVFRVMSVFWGSDTAMVISNSFRGDPKMAESHAVFVMTLKRFQEENKDVWKIDDVDLEELEGIQDEIGRFLEKHPDCEHWFDNPGVRARLQGTTDEAEIASARTSAKSPFFATLPNGVASLCKNERIPPSIFWIQKIWICF